MEIDLAGFRELVDAVGGVQVCFSRATRDRNTDDSGSSNQGGTGFAVSAGVEISAEWAINLPAPSGGTGDDINHAEQHDCEDDIRIVCG